MVENKPVIIIGGGLAGCEAAWQILRHGHAVHLYEMKPQKYSPAHKMDTLAELVCSNSFKSNSLDNATGLLKEEMRRLSSLIMAAADSTPVAAGSALAVDRIKFSQKVQDELEKQRNFTLSRIEVTKISKDFLTIIASGPLTSDSLAQEISQMSGSAYLYFYDALAPIIEADSIDMNKVFWASRYDKGTPDYLNCPLTKEEYEFFRQ
jgi:methylenetetrahydrofolate--tRNA-(uracil-5-)-methyltransferase